VAWVATTGPLENRLKEAAVPGAAPAPKVPEDRLKEAAAKRRAEILRGIDPAILIPGTQPEAETATETAQPAPLPAERRKQLYALAEEMELFYARTLGK
jgi:hypothetical protein